MPILLPIAVLLSAAACLSVELAIVRLSAPHVGQSLLPWTAAITAVLLGLTLGHVLGGRVCGPQPRSERLRWAMAVACLCAAAATFAIPSLIWPVANAFATEEGAGTASAIALVALCVPPSVAAGFVTPLAIRLLMADQVRDLPRRVAAIYAASAAGSVAGTAAAGFWLLELVGAAGLTLAAASAWTAIGLALLPWSDRPRASVLAGGAALLPAALVAGWGAPAGCTVESRYTCVRYLDTTTSQGDHLRFMILDEGVHSASDLGNPAALHLGYAALTDRLAMAAFAHSDAPRAIVIGGGGATLPRAWAKAEKPVSVVVAELDPIVAEQAVSAMGASGPGLRTVIGDGRAALRGERAGPSYDVVLMDAYRTRTVPPHLVTREFGTLVSNRLRDTGVFLSNVIDRGDTLLLARSLALTLATQFAVVDIWVVDDAEKAGSTNAVVAAWKSAEAAYRPERIEVNVSVMAADEQPKPRVVSWRRLGGEAELRTERGQCAILMTDDHAPVDRLLAGRASCAAGAAS